MRYVSLCSGVGGLDMAIDSLSGECLVQVEIEPYCRSILDLRWPDVPRHDDLRTFHYWSDPLTAVLGDLPVDLVTGGIPCQPTSHAGRRKGADDPRWLWPDALRVVREAQPARVFFENPMGLRTLGLDAILAELSGMGYGGAWEIVAAADVGAPHLRKRIFIMGIAGRRGWSGPTRPPGNRAVEWPTPTASGERPNEGNVRLLRQRVLAGDMTEDEAKGMLNGKSPFDAQGKVPAWPTPTAPGGGRVIPDDAEWVGRTTAYSDGKKLQVGLESAVRREPGLVSTPSHADGTGGPGTSPKREGGLNLRTYAAKFPTPLSVPTSKASHNQVSGRFREALEKAWERWPTPTSRDWKDSGDSIANGTVPVNGLLGRAVQPTRERGALSPDWAEWLMGWPIGWTDINCAEPGPVYGWESEPAIPRIGLGIPNRSKRLTAIGNGVVTAQAVFAWQRLSERLGVE